MKNRGFTLIELLGLLVLLAAFALVSGRLFISSMRLIHEVPRTENRAARLDGALHQLRQDVYHARACRLAADGALELDDPAASAAIVWRDSAAALVRTADDQPRTWKHLGVTFRFTLQGPLLLVELREGKAPPQTLAMPVARALGGAR